jgi:hypothetical protein
MHSNSIFIVYEDDPEQKRRLMILPRNVIDIDVVLAHHAHVISCQVCQYQEDKRRKDGDSQA